MQWTRDDRTGVTDSRTPEGCSNPLTSVNCCGPAFTSGRAATPPECSCSIPISVGDRKNRRCAGEVLKVARVGSPGWRESAPPVRRESAPPVRVGSPGCGASRLPRSGAVGCGEPVDDWLRAAVSPAPVPSGRVGSPRRCEPLPPGASRFPRLVARAAGRGVRVTSPRGGRVRVDRAGPGDPTRGRESLPPGVAASAGEAAVELGEFVGEGADIVDDHEVRV